MNLEKIQESIRARALSGWLFFDHHRRDPLAYRILGIPNDVEATRRWYYLIPAHGEPRKLVHRIESRSLDALPGSKSFYSSWPDQHKKLGELLSKCARVAMQYSPNCAIPYVSLVDGGTLELVRSLGVEVVTSADLVQEFEAQRTSEQFEMHLEAGKRVDEIRRKAFDLIGDRLRSAQRITEYEVKQFILRRFSEHGLTTTSHGPIVAVGAHASDPHYDPSQEHSAPIGQNDLVLIDLWAKLSNPNAVYYDVTWTGYSSASIPSHIENVFFVVRDARKTGSNFVITNAAKNQRFAGFEVDDVVRKHIVDQGYGDAFFHRTGHSIGTDVHGTGANMDNLESHDERVVIPGSCFSIEPGVYLPEFGIRSEVNVYVGDGFARVTGEEQEQLVRIG
jgi:Xaa-Pro dipeptidase